MIQPLPSVARGRRRNRPQIARQYSRALPGPIWKCARRIDATRASCDHPTGRSAKFGDEGTRHVTGSWCPAAAGCGNCWHENASGGSVHVRWTGCRRIRRRADRHRIAGCWCAGLPDNARKRRAARRVLLHWSLRRLPDGRRRSEQRQSLRYSAVRGDDGPTTRPRGGGELSGRSVGVIGTSPERRSCRR